jgi:hypothetical protein
MNRRTRTHDDIHDDSHDGIHDGHAHRTGADAPDVRSKGIRASRVKNDVGVAEARRQFGGFDLMASIAGLLAALGTLVLLSGLVGAAGSVGYRYGASDEDLSIGGFVAGLVVLLLAFFTGGWVAGRVARYDGGRNGIMAVAWFLLLAAGLAALGAWLGDKYNLFSTMPDLPNWFSGDDLGTAAVASAAIGALVALVAGWLGGIVGARYHKRADALVTHTRDGGVVRDDRVVDVRDDRDDRVATGYAPADRDTADDGRAQAGRRGGATRVRHSR